MYANVVKSGPNYHNDMNTNKIHVGATEGNVKT